MNEIEWFVHSLGSAESDFPLAYARIPIEAEDLLPSIRSSSEWVVGGGLERLRAVWTSRPNSVNASAIVETCSAAVTSAK